MTPAEELELAERQRQARPPGHPWATLANDLEATARRMLDAAAVLRALPLNDPSDELLARIVELELADRDVTRGSRDVTRARIAHDALLGVLFELLGPGWWRATEETAPAPPRRGAHR